MERYFGFQVINKYVTVILWNADSGKFLTEYDEELGENRLLELDVTEDDLASQLAMLVEEHALNLESYAELVDISHTEYVPNNEIPGSIDEEKVVFVTVTAKEVATDLAELPPEDFRLSVEQSSVLSATARYFILQAYL